MWRSDPKCVNPLAFEQSWEGEISTPMPEGDSFEFIAFPPDGKYDMYKLRRVA